MIKKWSMLVLSISLLFLAGFLVGKGLSPNERPTKTQKPIEPARAENPAPPSAIRYPAVAGQFYPADKKELQEAVNKYLREAQPPAVKGELLAVVVPHAGYMYSAQTAAYAYKLLAGQKIDTVILVGGSHYTADGVASIYDEGVFQTPLGDVPIDSQLAQKILTFNTSLDNRPQTHSREHSLEVQLPFIQTVLPNTAIVPIIIKRQTIENARLVAQAIVWAINASEKKIMIVASTDMSHYFPRATAQKMDSLAIQNMLALNQEVLYQDLIQKKTQLCGQAAVLAAIIATKSMGADMATELHYADSGAASGDDRSVVGYVAMAFSAQNPVVSKGEKMSLLDENAQKALLGIARDTAVSYVKDKKVPAVKVELPIFNEQWGAFVTITKNKQLRGCIGRFTPVDKPLYQIVQDMAVAASSEDPRFPPITAAEIPDLEFEISVLSPMQRVKDVNEIEVGKHGIYIVKGFFRGVLLPQVATEYGWDRLTFLQQTCRKAGLPPGAWQENDTEIYTFTAQVFHE